MSSEDNSKIIHIGATATGNIIGIDSAVGNRHGLVAGATGTGKTVTLQVLAEGFSRLGVPVFTADIKGDLSGVAVAAVSSEKLVSRANKCGVQSYEPNSCPVTLWDLYGENGHPIRTTVSEMGPLILGKLLDVNDAQQAALDAAFSIADDQGLLLLDIKDLQSMIAYLRDNLAELSGSFRSLSKASLDALDRRVLGLTTSEVDKFFGEPGFSLDCFIRRDSNGQGVINILDATKLVQDGRLYSTFLLWLLSELFENLDEVGDLPVPKLVFFFDEAHLLFDEVSGVLQEKIATMIRLIRSKGVGVYFVSQRPTDLPEEVLSQLGHRVQHALRAYTEKERKAVSSACDSFRANPEFETKDVIGELAIGEALVSTLGVDGVPSIVERVLVRPPFSRIGPLSETERKEIIRRSEFEGRFEEVVDRESAYEILSKRAIEKLEKQKQEEAKKKADKEYGVNTIFSQVTKQVIRALGYEVSRQISRGLLGALRGGRK